MYPPDDARRPHALRLMLAPDLPVNAGRVRQLMEAWARHEAWFQLGASDLDSYAWPVAGTKDIAQEGRPAYMAYRDYLAATFLAVEGYADLLDDLRRLVDDIEARIPGATVEILEPDGEHDPHFQTQWNNLFTRDPVWVGLSHESLSQYARKYEVERPLRMLAFLRELRDRGSYDRTLQRFRDGADRLKKGVLADYVTAGFKSLPALRAALSQGYSSKLRNLIGHNDYEIIDGTVTAIDQSFSLTETEFLSRVQALSAIQNALIWVASIRRHDPTDLAASGVVGIGWLPMDDDGIPRLRVLQLAAFRQFDPTVSWLTEARIAVRGSQVATTLGRAREREGPMEATLPAVILRIVETGTVSCEVVGVVPCLHDAGLAHQTYKLGAHLYCELDVADVGPVRAVVAGMDDGGEVASPSQAHL